MRPRGRRILPGTEASLMPTARLGADRAAYWCRVSGKAHVRWVLPGDEETALSALARLAEAGALGLGEGTKFAGMFRAHGLLVPVWDLPRDADGSTWQAPLAELADRYAQARATDAELTP